MSEILKGVGIGMGIVVNSAKVLKEVIFKYDEKSPEKPEDEIEDFRSTRAMCAEQISDLANTARKTISEDKADIFTAHLMMLEDEVMVSEIEELINQGYTPEYAIVNIYDKNILAFSQMDDKYFKERASDLADIKKRLLSISLDIKSPNLMAIDEECIIIAHDLTPSETILLNPNFVKGFITNIGGATSHAAIMAKTLGIPAIVSTKNATEVIKDGEYIALDIAKNEVYYRLSSRDSESWEKKEHAYKEILSDLEDYKSIPCLTKDKQKIYLYGNIGNPKEVKKVMDNGGKGIGLFRSEFLYMDSNKWPTEEEQFRAYTKVLKGGITNMPVTIRTLDIGGDKHLDYYQFPKELNPFLGYRALRMSLKETDIFKTQLRALCRSSVHGTLKVMFPMVTTLEEFHEARRIVVEVFEHVKNDGYPVPSQLNIGMMIEIPSSALMADKFAEVADFFSIGSNDLIQYTHAVDRMSEEVNYLYQPNSPSILKLIAMSADAAKKNDIPISVCGEMASLPKSVPILIGLGIYHLSMSAVSIPMINRIINHLKRSDCKKLAKQALTMGTEAEVDQLVDDFFKERNIVF